MENCIICNSNYKKSNKSDQINLLGHQEKVNQYYCKKCNLYMSLSCKNSHLNSKKIKTKRIKYGVKIVIKIYLIKQDISKVKNITKKVKIANGIHSLVPPVLKYK